VALTKEDVPLTEKELLEYLESNPSITISKFRRLAGLSALEAEEILVGFNLLQIIDMEYTAQSVNFHLLKGYRKIVEKLPGYQ